MAEYSFVTIWRLKAPIDAVWDALCDVDRWPSWWRYVERVVEIRPGDAGGLDAVRRLTWKTRLPYKLTFESRTTRVEPPFVLEATASGDLEGQGRWNLSSHAGLTEVRYEWRVATGKRWMNWLEPLARPLFKWNHDAVMQQGGEGLARFLGTQLVETE
jgi:uncharacterized protein YndB with AHSA1/START domain